MAQRSDSRTAAAVGTAAVVHQAAQAVLADDLLKAIRRFAWPQFDPQDIRGSMPRLVAVVMSLIHRYGSASSVHAAQYYKAQRVAAGIPGRYQVPVAQSPPIEQVTKSLEWATSGLYDASTPAAPEAPAEAPFTIEPDALEAALTNIEGVTETLVLDQSRDTILNAVQDDSAARGWARVPEANACSFCMLLATRGAIYKSKETAGPNQRGSRSKRAGMAFRGSGLFKVHDHCRCHVEPQFSDHYEPTAQVRAAQELYSKTPYGSGPAEARNNFRVALQRERDAGRF